MLAIVWLTGWAATLWLFTLMKARRTSVLPLAIQDVAFAIMAALFWPFIGPVALLGYLSQRSDANARTDDSEYFSDDR